MARSRVVCRTVRRRKSSGKPRRSTKVCVKKKTIVQTAITGLGLAGAFGAGIAANRRRSSGGTSRLRVSEHRNNGNGARPRGNGYKQGYLPGFEPGGWFS